MPILKPVDIFKLSPFVANQFRLFPDLSKLLTKKLDLTKDWQQFKTNNPQLDMFALTRKYRQSRLALIAAKDLLQHEPQQHIQTLKQISQLAQLLISYAQNIAQQEMQLKHGQVINANGEQQFIIFALGKLGGNELNYSSDIDLVFCYTGNGQSNGKKTLDALNYFSRLGRRIIQILDSATTDGIVYRVDMRLRPFGGAAPLVCSINHLLNYLESEGRDWERYAWLRASFISGNSKIAQHTLQSIRPFIYRKYLDYSIFESLRQIKAQIIRKQLDDKDNLKLGIGGIREIEFIVQTLQLTFAGRNQHLQGNDLWQQMHNLVDFGHLSVKELQQLTDAWLFLRKLENLCQIINDTDAHHLPKEIDKLAICMGLHNANTLFKRLNSHRANVHKIFDRLFLTNQASTKTSQSHPKIQALKDEISEKNHPKTNKHKIYAALDAIIPIINKFDDGDTIIQRYYQVINAVSKRQSYLSMLIESPHILEKLLNQISYGDYFSKTIANTPSLLETLFESIDSTDFDIPQQWQLFSNKHLAHDDEQYLELLCQFKRQIQFKAIIAYIDKFIDANTTSKILSQLAEYILNLVIKQAWQHIQNNLSSPIQANDLIVISYGSLAMQNMHLNSDFDVVFILNQDINSSNHKFIMRWIKRIIHLLTTNTYFGNLYALDTQLRPNGNSGTAIVSQTNFANYQLQEAWLWEHAALIKSRAVYATAKQKYWFKNLRKKVLIQQRNPQTVDKELTEMANKLQQLSNKNHQQEFNTLGTILKQAHDRPDIIDDVFIQSRVNQTKLDNSIHA